MSETAMPNNGTPNRPEKKDPPTPAEWADQQVRDSPDLTPEQIRNLCHIYGFDLDGD